MLRKVFLSLFLVCCICTAHVNAQAVMLDTAKNHFIKIDDVTLHYKVWGKGPTILLLHGAMEYWKEWERQIPALAKEFKVIAVDTRGHGSSTFTDRELSYELFAGDMLQMLDKLSIDSIDVVGFGDGGIIGMIMAMKAPHKVHKLVTIGSNLTADTSAVYQTVLEKVRGWDYEKMAFYLQMKFKDNPNPKMMSLLAKRMQKLMLTQPNLTYEDLWKIKCPTLVMAGDHDFIKLEHTKYIFENLPDGYLSIIPAATHYCNKERSQVVNATILDFLRWKTEHVSRF